MNDNLHHLRRKIAETRARRADLLDRASGLHRSDPDRRALRGALSLVELELAKLVAEYRTAEGPASGQVA